MQAAFPANARMMNVPKYVLHDGAVSSMTHRDKKVIVPAFEEESTKKKTRWLARSHEYDGGSESFRKEWIPEDDEMAEMAALVPEWFYTEMSNVNEDV